MSTPSPEQLTKDLLALLREVLPKESARLPLDEDRSLRELGVDSLGKATLGFRIEERYGVNLTEHAPEIAKIRTVGDYLSAARAWIQKARG